MYLLDLLYFRTTGLLKSGAIKEKPLWYDIYEAFPPKHEPRYDPPKSDLPIREIFYPEDEIRAYVGILFFSIEPF